MIARRRKTWEFPRRSSDEWQTPDGGAPSRNLRSAQRLLLAAATAVGAMVLHGKRRRRAEQEPSGTHAAPQMPYDRLRDINARLIDAQESERSRIARELHDDIGQQLAVLATDLRLSGDANEALARIDAIARSVRTLSHRLHPGMLRLAGLVESVRSLQREQSGSDVAIAFTHGDIPRDLPAAVTLSLFRVIQEGIQNAIRHGRPRQVSIDVRRVGSDVALSIVDDGRGFDVEAACGKGLGLISLVERVEGVGGTVVVCSKPGLGTKIEAQVPLRDRDGEPQAICASEAMTCQNSSPNVC